EGGVKYWGVGTMADEHGPQIRAIPGWGTSWYTRGPTYWLRRVGVSLEGRRLRSSSSPSQESHDRFALHSRRSTTGTASGASTAADLYDQRELAGATLLAT
ncbi:MAG TPA: hypothetical protein VK256_05815, partial [Candidatus Eisenbacteria bacterium]|nr:hypothetical protein [Candidatus Eisenbacteria bacterium]